MGSTTSKSEVDLSKPQNNTIEPKMDEFFSLLHIADRMYINEKRKLMKRDSWWGGC
jgi:hypothetical protein